jgi:hypothetical protein
MGVRIPPVPSTALLATGNHTITDEGCVNVDASAGPVTITYPDASAGTSHSVRKVDDSANAVTAVKSAGDGGGQLFVLNDQLDMKRGHSNGSTYTVK